MYMNNDNISENNLNNNENDINNMNMIENERISKITIGLIIIVSIAITSFDIYSFFHIINTIKKAHIIFPREVFEECYLYPRFCELFIEFLSFFLGVDLILLSTFPFFDTNFNLEIIFSKFSQIFFYLNYFIFGPFLMGLLFVSIKYSDKLAYVCINFNPNNKIVNYRLSFIFLFSITLSFVTFFFGSFYFENNFFSNSIKYKKSGNYLIGNIFWWYALKNSRRFRNAIHRNIPDIIDDA